MPSALHLALLLATREDAHLIDVGRWWQLVDASTTGFACFGAALFGATLGRILWTSLVLGGAGAVLAGMAAGVALFNHHDGVNLLPLAAPCALAVAGVLSIAAERNERELRDSDQPWASVRVWIAGSITLIFAVSGMGALSNEIVLELRQQVFAAYPWVGRSATGRVGLFVGDVPVKSRAVDVAHRPAGPALASDVLWWPRHMADEEERVARQFRYAPIGRQSNSRHTRYRWISCPLRAWCAIGSDGFMHVIHDVRFGPPEWRRIGKAPDGRPFPGQAQIVADDVGRLGLAVMGDPQDGQVWIHDFNLESPGFQSHALPGGDGFVEFIVTLPPMRAPGDMVHRSEVLIQGRRGIYVLREGGIAAAGPETLARYHRLEEGRLRPPKVRRRGLVSYELSLPARQDTPAFQHLYAPRTVREWVFASAAWAVSIAQPPVLVLASALGPKRRDLTWQAQRMFINPLAGPGFVSIVAANLVISVLLVGICLMTLRRRGLPRGRRLYWTVAIVVGGVPALLCCRAIEARRAWQRVDVLDARRPALLIQSA